MRRIGTLVAVGIGSLSTMSAAKPKATAPLSPDARDALRRRVETTSARAVGRDLAVSPPAIRRALAGEPVTHSIVRLIELQLLPVATGPNPSHAAASQAA